MISYLKQQILFLRTKSCIGYQMGNGIFFHIHHRFFHALHIPVKTDLPYVNQNCLSLPHLALETRFVEHEVSATQ